MEEKLFSFDLFALGLGIFIGVIVLDVVFGKKDREQEPEHLVTSTGRKIYLHLVEE